MSNFVILSISNLSPPQGRFRTVPQFVHFVYSPLFIGAKGIICIDIRNIYITYIYTYMYMFKKIEPTEIGYLAFLFLKPIMNKHK